MVSKLAFHACENQWVPSWKHCQDLLLLPEQDYAAGTPSTPNLLRAAASEILPCNLVSVFKNATKWLPHAGKLAIWDCNFGVLLNSHMEKIK